MARKHTFMDLILFLAVDDCAKFKNKRTICNSIMWFIFNLQRKKIQPEIASNVDIYPGTIHNESKLLILITMEPICLQEYSRRGHKCSSMPVPMSLVY